MELDPRLIKDCKKGDRKAQFALYRLCYPILMGVCLRYRKNEADAAEMLNMAFLKILDNLDKWTEQIPFAAWAKRITINTMIDDFRKNRKVKELISSTSIHDLPEAQGGMDYNEADKQFDAEQLESFIKKLPPMSSKVFNLFAIDGYPHTEISIMLGISEGTSRWHLASARKKLQEMMRNAMNASKIV
ncbi:MAG: RNA polymerase sigma factor [Phaeodactylibacter sp.]|nr:RNA polymerase sigma factor [Phaeodactylibacter sp.]